MEYYCAFPANSMSKFYKPVNFASSYCINIKDDFFYELRKKNLNVLPKNACEATTFLRMVSGQNIGVWNDKNYFN